MLPVVEPHIPGLEDEAPLLALQPRPAGHRGAPHRRARRVQPQGWRGGGVEGVGAAGGAGHAGCCQLKPLWEVEEEGVKDDRDHKMPRRELLPEAFWLA